MPNLIRHYNDGPAWPITPELMAAERAYRDAFLAATKEASRWPRPNVQLTNAAWEERRKARRAARVPKSGIYLYREGHQELASRTRGKVHAYEFVAQCWDEFIKAKVDPQPFWPKLMNDWAAQVEQWASQIIEPRHITTPPRPKEHLPLMATTHKHLDSIIRRLCEVERETLEWLWPGRVPLGKLTLLAGDPGLGKSFVTLDMAARVSRGEAWPDTPLLRTTPGGVVLFNAEDDVADTIAPRLDKAEADDRNIIVFEGVAVGDRRRSFSLEADLPRLEAVLEHHDTRLVVIDPIAAYCGKVDSHNNTDVRGLLAPLADMAGRHRVAVLAVTHLSKGGGGKAVYRAMGSLAFAAAARAVWAIVKDTNDPARRLFLPAKLNLASDPDGLAYRVLQGRVAWDMEPVRLHADQAFAMEAAAAEGRRGSQQEQAKVWLQHRLAKEAVPSKEVIEEAKEDGITEITLRRAFKAIGGQSKKADFDQGWLWLLSQDDQVPP